MGFIDSHFGELLMAIMGLGGTILGGYLAVRLDLNTQKIKHEALKEKIDEHIDNKDVHVHRREGDPTGYYHPYGS